MPDPEKQAEEKDPNREDDQIRTTLANTYTFVRSREINKVISNFTFDHYIDEAKRSIKEDRILLAASGQSPGKRPSQLTALATLKTDFTNNYPKMKELAEQTDKAGEQETPKDTEAASLPDKVIRDERII